MRIVIVGASRFGLATGSQLLDAGHDVILVDRDAEKLDRLRNDYEFGLIHGDGSLPSVQRDAFGDHADALVLLTNVDDVNILAAIVGRAVGFERVVPQIVRPELIDVCQELGLDDLITPHTTVARSIVRAIETDAEFQIDVSQQKGIRVLGLTVTAAQDGQRIDDISLPEHARAVAILREEGPVFVTRETRLEEGATLLIAAAPEVEREVIDLFSENGS